MLPFQLAAGDPLSLIMAADARLSSPDYVNDQIWELRLEGSEPPAIMLQTTYGLRARWMRIFPRLICKEKTYVDPSQFHQVPKVEAIFPNFLRLTCSPYNGLDILIEYWACSSQVVALRVQIKNTTILKETLRLEWAALLSPLDDGVGMSPVSSAGSCYLVGRSGELVPILVMEGCSQAGSGSFPALSQEVELYPGNAHTFILATAASESEEKSVEIANTALKCAWESQVARIELQNFSQLIKINSGRAEWDAAFLLAQISAYGLFMPGGQVLPNPTFVLSRQPDLGYSLRGDGSDYSALWKGQTVLDAYYLASLILPGGVQLVKGLIENFLFTQDETGRLDWRPGLDGRRSQLLAQPLLATLAWQVSHYLPQPENWLGDIYSKLSRFLQSWFRPEMDRDGDGFPEWEQPMQTGLEDLPLYNPWHPDVQGIEISLLECPLLSSLLIQECANLEKIALLIGKVEDVEWLTQRQLELKAGLDDCWDQRSGTYQYRDFRSHQRQGGGIVKTCHGSGTHALGRTFQSPQRLIIKLSPADENTRTVTVRISGGTTNGEETEVISPRGWTWVMNRGRAICHTLFASVHQVIIDGAAPDDLISLHRIDHRQIDMGTFTPLWAGVPSTNTAKKLVKHVLLNTYLRPFGAPVCYQDRHPANPTSLDGISPLWIQLLGEGLIRYGEAPAAMELFSRTMDATCDILQRYASFSEMIDAETGQPMGERNHLRGLAPLGLFLKLIGIEKLTEYEVELRDFNPFPWSVTVKYRGMTILCRSAETVVTFANGQTARVSGPGPHRVRLE